MIHTLKLFLEVEYFNNFIQTIKQFGIILNINIDSLILKNKVNIDKFYTLISSHIKIENFNLLSVYQRWTNIFWY